MNEVKVILNLFLMFGTFFYLGWLYGKISSERKFEKLRKTVSDLYFAAYWSPDRYVPNEDKLWENVRDAALIQPGQTFSVLGSRKGGVAYTYTGKQLLNENKS